MATHSPTQFCGIPPFTNSQNLALQVCPHVTGVLCVFWGTLASARARALTRGRGSRSMVADCIIMYRVGTTEKRKRKVSDRLLFGMSLMNFIGAFAYFLAVWPIPNYSFCQFQGFMIQLNAAVYWYNGMLATNFLLRIVREWKEFEVERIEPWLHFTAWAYPVATSFAALGLNMYGNAKLWCWITGSFDWARWAFFYGPLWFFMLSTAVIMCAIVWKVHQSDVKAKQHREGTNKGQHRMSVHTREVAIQGIFFVACFWLTWVFGSANRIQNSLSPPGCFEFPLMLLHSFFVPLQGFMNLIVYLLPRYRAVRFGAPTEAVRREQPGRPPGRTMRDSVRDWFIDVGIVLFGKGDVSMPRPRRTSGTWIDSGAPRTQEAKAEVSRSYVSQHDQSLHEDTPADSAAVQRRSGGAAYKSPPLGSAHINVKFVSGHESVMAPKTPSTTPSANDGSNNTLRMVQSSDGGAPASAPPAAEKPEDKASNGHSADLVLI